MSLIRRIVHPYRRRVNYWSNSKFAEWITSTFATSKYTKPPFATMEEWECREELYSVNHPFIYWITDEFLDKVQNLIYYPYDVFCDVRAYIRNRFIDKTHLVQMPLEKGEWYDSCTRLLEANFAILVFFVEREDSIKNLTWAATLTKGEDWGLDKSHPEYGKPTDQAESAKTILELYNWWKVERPARVDPWQKVAEKYPFKGFRLSQSKEEKEAGDNALRTEEQYKTEDDEMLLKLVKIRNHLWT